MYDGQFSLKSSSFDFSKFRIPKIIKIVCFFIKLSKKIKGVYFGHNIVA